MSSRYTEMEARNQGAGLEIMGTGLVGIKCSDAGSKSVRWLFDGLIPVGEVTMVAADGQSGKSVLMIEMMARLSRGEACLGHKCCFSKKGAKEGVSLVVHAEDSLQATINPRLMVAGGDLEKIYFCDHVRTDLGIPNRGIMGSEEHLLIDLHTEIEAVEDWMGDHKDEIGLVVIDPISAYLGNKNENSNADVKVLITRMAKLAQQFDCAVVMVHHYNKNSEASAKNKMLGSVAWYHGPRVVYGIKTESLPHEPAAGILAATKMNLEKAPRPIRFHIESRELRTSDGHDRTSPKAIFDGELGDDEIRELDMPGYPGEGQRKHDRNKQQKSQRETLNEDICAWLGMALKSGPMRMVEIKQIAVDAKGWNWQTVHNVANRRGDIVKRKFTDEELEQWERKMGPVDHGNAWHRHCWEMITD